MWKREHKVIKKLRIILNVKAMKQKKERKSTVSLQCLTPRATVELSSVKKYKALIILTQLLCMIEAHQLYTGLYSPSSHGAGCNTCVRSQNFWHRHTANYSYLPQTLRKFKDVCI